MPAKKGHSPNLRDMRPKSRAEGARKAFSSKRHAVPSAEPRPGTSRLTSALPHPAMTDVPYSDAESEYLTAVASWQRITGVRFPTACDYRQVLISLGYRKVS